MTGTGNDIDMLSYVKKTAVASNKIMTDLQQLKGKIYSIEKDFRTVHDH